jgi:hypothetical protein
MRGWMERERLAARETRQRWLWQPPAAVEVLTTRRSVLGGRRWESSFSLSFSVGACREGNGPTCRRIVLCTIACGRAADVRSESNG